MNKINNNILKQILIKSKKYRTIDVMLLLIDTCEQIRIGSKRYENVFIVKSHNSAYSLWNEINLKFPNKINSTTFRECLNELKELNILAYNEKYDGFEILKMSEMLKKKQCGYTEIRKFFLEDAFFNMSFSHKKVFLYLIHLLDKKKHSKLFKEKYLIDIFLNLNNYKKKFDNEELNIMNILNTKNVYYAKEVLDNLLLNYPTYFISSIEKLRQKSYGKIKGKSQGVCVDLTYFFNIQENIKNDTFTQEEEYYSLIKKYSKLNDKMERLTKEIGISLPIVYRIRILNNLYKYLPYVQDQVIIIFLKKLKRSIYSKEQLLNPTGYLQHLINVKAKRQFHFKKSYQRGWTDSIMEV